MADPLHQTTPPGDGWEPVEIGGKVVGYTRGDEFLPVEQRCPKCGAKGHAFICSRPGCPVNGGAAYE